MLFVELLAGNIESMEEMLKKAAPKGPILVRRAATEDGGGSLLALALHCNILALCSVILYLPPECQQLGILSVSFLSRTVVILSCS